MWKHLNIATPLPTTGPAAFMVRTIRRLLLVALLVASVCLWILGWTMLAVLWALQGVTGAGHGIVTLLLRVLDKWADSLTLSRS